MEARQRRILFVIGTLALGGAESQVVMLAEGLHRSGWRVGVFCLEKSGALLQRLESVGIEVVDGGFRSGPSTQLRKALALAIVEVQLVWRVIRFRPHVVHSFLPLANFVAVIAARIGFAPLVVTSKRALGRHQDRHPKAKWMDSVANALSHVITANSKAVAEDTARRDRLHALSVVVIPNGLDFTRFEESIGRRLEGRKELGLADGEVAVVMVANLIAYKGHFDLLRAFARAAEARAGLRLFLIGEDRGIGLALAAEARRLGIDSRVTFMGGRRDVPDLLAAMDIAVMSSHEEGMSNALLEKLAAGLPVVATDVGGNPEALEGMPDCILVRPSDPEDLARGLLHLIDKLSSAAASRDARRREVRDRYSIASMVAAHERLYCAANSGQQT